MSEHPLDLSTRIIDSGTLDTPVNRMTEQVSELADDIAIVESFSHSVLVDTGAGLVAFDTSVEAKGPAVVEAARTWRTDPFDSMVYTHGHLEHRLACHLIELAMAAEPESRAVNEARIQIYQARRAVETSLMAKGIYKGAASDSEAAISGELPDTEFVLDITS